jgi:hypothetical protein
MGGFGMGMGMGMGMSGMGRGPMMRGPRRPRGPSIGCGSVVAVLAFIMLVIVITNFVGESNSVPRSTVRREALPAGSAGETGALFTDNLNWIRNADTLNAGLRSFHERTGVRPHLYITSSIDNGEAYAERIYAEKFDDQAHLLFIFAENDGMWFWRGGMTLPVLDGEAMDILMSYVESYYFRYANRDEMFARAFGDAGDRIMSLTRSPWIPVFIIAGVIAVLLILMVWWKKRMEQKNREAEQTERILNTPLETLGEDEAARLAREYEEDN